ncbi:MAG TPA: phage baseplate protein, partial [Arsenophonus nasoniae]|uniref:phage baseplate protein n=1 Tax=Arsenophonus nasoniae TaxID=638 RepID=UPI00387A5EA6
MKKIGDVPPTATPAGEFTNGNVAAGIAPTILEGEWFNSVQREILNVLLKAKIEQNPDIDDQLTQAILKLAGTALGGKIKQTLGNSTTDVVSQNTVTEEVNKKLDKTSILQTTGNATDKVMSQDAVTKAVQNAMNINTLYPVGIVVWFAQNKNPNTLFPDTKWQYLGENKTIRLAKADGSNVFTTGGSDAIKLTEAQLPAHGHTFSATTSSYDYGTKNTNETGEHVHNYTNKSGST